MYLQADLGSGCCCSGRWDLSQIVVGAGTSGISCGRTLLVGQVGQEQSARHQHKVFKGFPITVIQVAHMDSISWCSIHFFLLTFQPTVLPMDQKRPQQLTKNYQLTNKLTNQKWMTDQKMTGWPKTVRPKTTRFWFLLVGWSFWTTEQVSLRVRQ